MTPEQRDLILNLMIVPGRGPALAPEEFLRQYGESDGRALALRLMTDATEARNDLEAELSIVVTANFGCDASFLPPLSVLAVAGWHHKHEDVAWLLGQTGSQGALAPLRALARDVPDYLAELDDGHSLFRQITMALGVIPGEKADELLHELATSEDDFVVKEAHRQLRKREARATEDTD